MNTINQASVFIKGENKYDLSLTINITIMMVLASIYLSVSSSLPETAQIKPVELWLLFNLIYNFCLIITLVIMQKIDVNQEDITKVNEAFPKKKKYVWWMDKLKVVRFVAEILLPCVYFLFAITTNWEYKSQFFS